MGSAMSRAVLVALLVSACSARRAEKSEGQ